MTEYYFEDFLTVEKSYLLSEKRWEENVNEVLNSETCSSQDWVIELGAKFDDGTLLKDGNPLLVAQSNLRKKYFRIVQLDRAESEVDFTAWSKYDDEHGMSELTISCVLSDKSLSTAKSLLIEFIRAKSIEDTKLILAQVKKSSS